jgi:hypothetical protein
MKSGPMGPDAFRDLDAPCDKNLKKKVLQMKVWRIFYG